MFGDSLKVYLDLFHAVKRVSDKIPKRHPLRQECVEDLRMVFRDPTDQGVKRTKETPSPDVLTLGGLKLGGRVPSQLEK